MILGIENESVYLLTTHITVLLPFVVDILGSSSSCFQALECKALMVEPCVVEVDDVVIFDIVHEGRSSCLIGAIDADGALEWSGLLMEWDSMVRGWD